MVYIFVLLMIISMPFLFSGANRLFFIGNGIADQYTQKNYREELKIGAIIAAIMLAELAIFEYIKYVF